jgi:glucan phosphorylase
VRPPISTFPLAAITLLHRKGYFHQSLDANGWQTEESVQWVVKDVLIEMPQRAALTIEDLRDDLSIPKENISQAHTEARRTAVRYTSCGTK